MKQHSVAVILPCRNEEAAVGATVTAFRAALPGAVIYVFDNNSTDNTVNVARAAGAIVRTELTPGKGNVVRRSFADIDADVYVMADGDATYDAATAPTMIRELIECRLDMVVGVRSSVADAAFRPGHRLGNAILTGMLSRIFGLQFDPELTSTAKEVDQIDAPHLILDNSLLLAAVRVPDSIRLANPSSSTMEGDWYVGCSRTTFGNRRYNRAF